MSSFQYDFEWNPAKAGTNLRKHGISFERAATVFKDSEALSLYDRAHSRGGEDRWITLGIDSHAQLLVSLSHLARVGGNRGALPNYLRPWSDQSRGSAISGTLNMKKQYDFSKAERGRFYRVRARFKFPVYLEPKIEARLSTAARKHGEDLGALVNRLLKREIELAEVLR